ncbi:MAG TPA: aldo/keto reductase, partial [Chthoniobacterales bacterium]|nr:aldo/keto reductase [Chthoniobacterales bacterium]
MSRRTATRLLGFGAAAVLLRNLQSYGAETDAKSPMLTRSIPSTGEQLPVIGLGTWQTFDVGPSATERKPLQEVLATFIQLGGRVVDSSPMYGRAEEVVGEIATRIGQRERLFLATKVWTSGKQAGLESMERSLSRLQTKRIDLMQVHNLVDVATHLATMHEWKAEGRLRYIGVTHYTENALEALERVLRSEKLDFVQINYSIGERAAEPRILPLAQERGVAVLVNRPFGGGDLFSRVRSKPLPGWAAEFDCSSWAQFLLKWIIAN